MLNPPLYRTTMASPVGELTLIAGDAGLTAIRWQDDRPDRSAPPPPTVEDADHPVVAQARSELDEYFAGHRRTFTLPLHPAGTPFQRAVWDALVAIPFGETVSYAAIARAIGQPSATRAVGAANGRNPLPIIVPCHRVIGASGSLTGFGGGLPAKAWLLRHEAASTPVPGGLPLG